MRIKIVPFIILLLFLSFCTKNEPDKLDNLEIDNIDYFAFGNAHGMCQGDCTNFFIIINGKIYPDDMDYYLGTSLKFKSDALPVGKYDLAKKLIDSFPTYLVDNPNKTFGCPDCIDQGGIHIEIKEKGLIKRWHFDTTISSLPSEIQDYVQEIAVVLEQLK